MTGEVRRSAPSGHVCWAYDDPAAFDAQAGAFLTEGLAAGERVWYVAPGQPEPIVERLRGVRGFPDALRRGAAQIVPISSAYSTDRVIVPAAQVATYAAGTEEALGAGYTGLRVIADATSLVRTPDQLNAFARYEHLIDRYMRARPMSAMCAYDRRELGDRVIAELACMHPETNAAEVLFRLYACDSGDGCAAVAGELDRSTHELFSTALERAELRPVDGKLVVRATDLRFIDHRILMHLDDYARRHGATAVLHTSRSAAARLVELLGLSRVRVEAA